MGLPNRIPDDDATVLGGLTAVRSAGSSSPSATEASMAAPALAPGTVLAERYEILQLLGQGGMGAVYKARDRELDRLVALKTIRREMAGHAAMLARFKQEIILARQITHRNVIRIYDIGEAGGTKFITMEYVEGEDLRTLLEGQSRLPQAEAIDIIQQVCRALEAAHAEGVIHRDLKPGNIMRDAHGRVVVMDFGLARSLGLDGITQTGALVGTLDYMSPEQALGGEIDTRSDLFAVGLIFFELLTGKVPYKADTSIASLLKRSQERASRASEVDASVPPVLSDIVSKCLERDQSQRYQSAAEILRDLERFQSGSAVRIAAVKTKAKRRNRPYLIASVALAVAVLGAGAGLRHRLWPGSAQKQSSPSGPVASIAILPFRNTSGDPSLDWLGSSVADMLTTDVGQSHRVRMVSSDRVHQIIRDLRLTTSSADENSFRRVAEFSKADEFVWGEYARFGDDIRITAKLHDLRQQKTVALDVVAHGEKDVLNAVKQLADSIQQNLTLSRDALAELKGAAFTPSTKSVAALKEYDQGLQLARAGKHQEAQERFESATKQDPGFALAYAKLAETHANLGHSRDAEQAARRALDLANNVPAPEKYRIEATFARVVHDNGKAIKAYEDLARVTPEDYDVLMNLAGLYAATGDLQRARQNYTKLLAQDPNSVDALLGLGELEISSGNPQAAPDPLNRALSLAVQLDNQQQKAAALNSLGFAYYQLGKTDDAMRNLQESLAIQQKIGDKRGVGSSLNAIGRVQEFVGKLDKAVSSYEQALKIRREIDDQPGIGGTLINLGNVSERRGRYDDALRYYKESLRIQQELGDQAYVGVCLNNIGSAYLDSGQYADALTYFQQALQVRQQLKVPAEIGKTLHNLGEAYLKSGHYDEALNYYLQAVELLRNAGDQHGAAEETLSMGMLFAEQGRYQAALQAQQDALNAMKSLNEHGYWMAFAQGSYGRALGLMARFDEAEKNIRDALALAQNLHQDALIAQLLKFQGDVFFYRGQYQQAQQYYGQALNTASKTTDRDLILISKASGAKAAVELGETQAPITVLRQASQEADRRGLKSVGAECALYLGKALLNAGNHAQARKQFETALSQSETLGMKALQAQSHLLLAKAARLSGAVSDASQHEDAARRLAADIRSEAKIDSITKRSDLAPLYNLTATK